MEVVEEAKPDKKRVHKGIDVEPRRKRKSSVRSLRPKVEAANNLQVLVPGASAKKATYKPNSSNLLIENSLRYGETSDPAARKNSAKNIKFSSKRVIAKQSSFASY